MELSDYITVTVPFNDVEEKVYRDILVSCGLNEPFVVDTNQPDLKTIAKQVAGIIGNRKSVIIGHNHSNIAFCYPKETLITFDSHNDSFALMDEYEFHCGYFLHLRENDTYILGCGVKSNDLSIKNFSPRKVDKILDVNLPKNIFLSLDIDAFNLSVTDSHNYTDTHRNSIESTARAFGREFHLSFQKVLDLSLGLTEGRNLVGINIAEYDPKIEGEPYYTAELLKTYLGIVLGRRKAKNHFKMLL